MMDQKQQLIEKLDAVIALGQELNDLWDKNTQIMESQYVTIPFNRGEQGRSSR